jgi:hypothetical protein
MLDTTKTQNCLVRGRLEDLNVRTSFKIFRTEISCGHSMKLCVEVDHKHIYVMCMKNALVLKVTNIL